MTYLEVEEERSNLLDFFEGQESAWSLRHDDSFEFREFGEFGERDDEPAPDTKFA